jgi:hypothetical protein
MANESLQKNRVYEIKELMSKEVKQKSSKNPETCLPKNDYDEIFENCYLSNE